VKFWSKMTRFIDREWIRENYSGSATLWQRAIWLAPVIAATLLVLMFDFDVGGSAYLIVMLGSLAVFWGLVIWTYWRWFAGYGRTKRWERISRTQKSSEASIDEVRP
jgi:hypothetical protein